MGTVSRTPHKSILALLGLSTERATLTAPQRALRSRLDRRFGLYLLLLVFLPSLLLSLPVFQRAWAIRPLPLAKKDGYVDAAIGLVPEPLIWLNPIGSAMALAPEIHGCFPKNPNALRGGLRWTKTFGGAQLAGAFWFFFGALIETGCVALPLLTFWQVREERRGGIRRGPQQFIGLVVLPLLFLTLLFGGHLFGWAILRFFILPIHANQASQYDFLIISAKSMNGGRDVFSSPPAHRGTTMVDATTSETVRLLLSEERMLELDPHDLLWNFSANDRAHLERNVHAIAALYGVDADTMEGIRGRIESRFLELKTDHDRIASKLRNDILMAAGSVSARPEELKALAARLDHFLGSSPRSYTTSSEWKLAMQSFYPNVSWPALYSEVALGGSRPPPEAKALSEVAEREMQPVQDAAIGLHLPYSAATALLEDTGQHPHGAESIFRNAFSEAEASGIPRERILKLREVFVAHEEKCFSREHGFRLVIDWAPVSLERARLGDRIVWLCHWRGNEKASVALSRQDRLLEKLSDTEPTPDERTDITYSGFHNLSAARASWFFLVIDEETNEVLGSDGALW